MFWIYSLIGIYKNWVRKIIENIQLRYHRRSPNNEDLIDIPPVHFQDDENNDPAPIYLPDQNKVINHLPNEVQNENYFKKGSSQ